MRLNLLKRCVLNVVDTRLKEYKKFLEEEIRLIEESGKQETDYYRGVIQAIKWCLNALNVYF